MLRNKGILLCIAVLLVALTLSAQTQDWLWVARGGGESVDFSKAMANDNNGNSYFAGYFSGTTQLGGTSLTATGGYDILIAKLDANGNWLWAKKAGGTGADWALGIALDANANVYLTGYFSDSATFGSSTLVSNGISDAFIAKMDTNGNWMWAKNAGGISSDYGYAIAVDSSANVYVTGCFLGSADFGGTTLQSLGNTDVFISKLNSAGDWLTTVQGGGVSYDYGYSIAVDDQFHVYLTGIFQGTTGFGTTSLSSVGGYDVFITKLDDSLNWLWAKRVGGSVSDWAYAIAVDSAHNIYLTGSFVGSITFGSQVINSTGNEDIYIAKMDTNSNWMWARKAGGTSVDYSYSLALDNTGNAYIGGYFTGSAAFGTFGVVSRGATDAFIAKINSSGEWLWAKRAGGTSVDKGSAVSTDINSNVYFTGTFYETASFVYTTVADSIMVTSGGAADVFVTKIGVPSALADETNIQQAPFSLGQNYPNPFNPTTSISFEVKDDRAFYNLSIYDLKGRKVTNLHSGLLTRGIHSLAWNGKDYNNNSVASGIYYYRLDNGNTYQTKKMVLMK